MEERGSWDPLIDNFQRAPAQKPFGNFVKNSLRIWQQRDVDELWEAIQAQVAF